MTRLPRRSNATIMTVGAIALAAMMVLTAPGSTFAHSGYESSTPADGEVVAESPPEVAVTFGQEMARSGGLPSMILVNDSGDIIADEAVLSDEDRTLLTLELPAQMADGRYTAIWHTLSDEDGEEAQGAFHFYVGSGPDSQATVEPGAETDMPTAAPTEPPSETSNDGDGGVPVWALVAGVIGGAIAGAGIGMAFGGRRGA